MSVLLVSGAEALATGGAAGGAAALAGRRPHRSIVSVAPAAPPRSGVAVAPARRLAIALVAAATAWLVSGWIAAGVWAGIGGWSLPALAGQASRRTHDVDALDAWASWVDLFRGSLAGQASVAGALLIACERAPEGIRSATDALREAMGRQSLPQALDWWARNCLERPELRQVAMLVQLAGSGEGGETVAVLGQLSSQLRQRAASARRIERDRHRVRVSARATVGVEIVWILGAARFAHGTFAFYDSVAGQVILGALLGVIALGVWLFARLDRSLG